MTDLSIKNIPPGLHHRLKKSAKHRRMKGVWLTTDEIIAAKNEGRR